VDRDEPIAAGRDADIFDAGPGLVRRRTRDHRSQELEARVMEWVVDHGYPAPKVHEVTDDGRDLVMERVDGPTMLDDLGDHPWRMRRYARMLADLHLSLRQIPSPDWLPAGPVPGDRVVHLDLHPQNVLLTTGGPVVIDWTNSRAGAPGSDVAITWLIMSCADIPGPRWQVALFGALRSLLVRMFLRRAGRADAVPCLHAMADWKSIDGNMRPSELEAMRALAARLS
jgi:aminoglycoside phosphotransferase (APT) family kinase protein